MSYFQTKDGSYTYISPIYGDAFHSRHGAFQESQHVFVDKAIEFSMEKGLQSIRIFEMGLGSGLNLLLTLLSSELDSSPFTDIIYDCIEKHPLSWEKAKGLEFCPQLPEYHECARLFESIHTCRWNQYITLTPGFSLKKMKGDFLATEFSGNTYDIIYYDAFAPSTQPELWSIECCELLYRILKKHGILTTYCAQGQFKRNLQTAGFEVEALPGPPGKREMTRATKV